MPNETTPVVPVTPGTKTSEYEVAQSANVWSSIGLILGVIISVGSTVIPQAPGDSKWGIISGVVLAVVSQIYDCLAKLGYIKSRTDVKVSSSVK